MSSTMFDRHPIRGQTFFLLAIFACVHTLNANDDFQKYECTAGGVSRVALAHYPIGATKRPTPVIFVFHGQGGQMLDCIRNFAIHDKWSESIVIYMQCVPSIAPNDPEGKLTGWQREPGEFEDRDLKYFDVVLSDFRRNLKVDDVRIYVVGHSDGAAFAYLLWSQRGEQLAGVASCGMLTHRKMVSTFKPKPLLQIAGKRDTLATLSQQELMVAAIREINECGHGQPWYKKGCTKYTSEIDCPVVLFVHSGGHEIPNEAPGVIVEFFKKEAKPKSISQKKNP